MKTEEIKEEARKWIEENGEKGSSDMLIELTSKAKDKEFIEMIEKFGNKITIGYPMSEIVRRWIIEDLENLKQKLEEK